MLNSNLVKNLGFFWFINFFTEHQCFAEHSQETLLYTQHQTGYRRQAKD